MWERTFQKEEMESGSLWWRVEANRETRETVMQEEGAAGSYKPAAVTFSHLLLRLEPSQRLLSLKPCLPVLFVHSLLLSAQGNSHALA